MLYIAADHAGFNLKEELKNYLTELNCPYEDMGAFEFNPQDDYPDFAISLARRVAEESEALGILICGSGVGVCIVANRFKNIRAALVYDEFTARQSREHDNANILCLGSRVLDEATAKKLVKIWLETEFSGEERHIRRLKKIEEFDFSI